MRAFLLLLALPALAAACGDPIGLPNASIPNRVDTLSLYALSGTPVALPSGYSMTVRQVVRTDQNTLFDIAFEIDTAGRALLLTTGALKIGRASGIQLSGQDFDSIRVAPTGGYQFDSVQVVTENSVVLLRSRQIDCLGLPSAYYAKLHVIAIDTASSARRMDFEVLTNVNCGYRGLEAGLPKR